MLDTYLMTAGEIPPPHIWADVGDVGLHLFVLDNIVSATYLYGRYADNDRTHRADDLDLSPRGKICSCDLYDLLLAVHSSCCRVGSV